MIYFKKEFYICFFFNQCIYFFQQLAWVAQKLTSGQNGEAFRTRWRDDVSRLAWERLEIHPEEETQQGANAHAAWCFCVIVDIQDEEGKISFFFNQTKPKVSSKW